MIFRSTSEVDELVHLRGGTGFAKREAKEAFMITIIDYGMGNLRSIQKAFLKFYPKVRVGSNPLDVINAERIVLPGVGAFGKAMEELTKRNLVGAIIEALGEGKLFLGICLGFQLLFSESEEGGKVKGLGVLKGKVKRFKQKKGIKIPHMGWNEINSKFKIQNPKILNGVSDGSYMYFVHSYYAEPEDKDIVLCETEYGGFEFVSGICKDNIYAFQFHPEKSQKLGLRIIKNFVEL